MGLVRQLGRMAGPMRAFWVPVLCAGTNAPRIPALSPFPHQRLLGRGARHPRPNCHSRLTTAHHAPLPHCPCPIASRFLGSILLSPANTSATSPASRTGRVLSSSSRALSPQCTISTGPTSSTSLRPCRLRMPSHPGPAVWECRPTLASPCEDAMPPRPCGLRMLSHLGIIITTV